MSAKVMNANAAGRYACRVRVPKKGKPVTPTAGEVSGILFRLSTKSDVSDPLAVDYAINVAVKDLPAAEEAGEPGLFNVDISQALHQAHIRPLGAGTSYYGIWYKAGDADMEVQQFVVALSTTL